MLAERRQKCPAHVCRSNSFSETGVFEKNGRGEKPQDDRVADRVPCSLLHRAAAQKHWTVRLDDSHYVFTLATFDQVETKQLLCRWSEGNSVWGTTHTVFSIQWVHLCGGESIADVGGQRSDWTDCTEKTACQITASTLYPRTHFAPVLYNLMLPVSLQAQLKHQ